MSDTEGDFFRETFEKITKGYIDEKTDKKFADFPPEYQGNKEFIDKIIRESKTTQLEIDDVTINPSGIRNAPTDVPSEVPSGSEQPGTSASSTRARAPGARTPGATPTPKAVRAPVSRGGGRIGRRFISQGGAVVTKDLHIDAQINDIIKNNSKMSEDDKDFIRKKTVELLKIEDDIMKIGLEHKYRIDYSQKIKPLMYRLHRNILYLYFKKRDPNQIEYLNQFIKKTDEKIEIFNQTIAKAITITNGEAATSIDKASIESAAAKELEVLTKLKQELSAQSTVDLGVLETSLKAADVNVDKLNESLGSLINQSGGSFQDKTQLVTNLNMLFDIYNLFNSESIVKIFALISVKSQFDLFIKKINETLKPTPSPVYKNTDIIDFFLVHFDDANLKLKLGEKYQKYMERDTRIYQEYTTGKPSSERIFSYKLLTLIKNDEELKDDESLYPNIFNLMKILFINFIKFYIFCIKITSDKTIITGTGGLDSLYQEFINGKKKVYTFIKMRQDTKETNATATGAINPRYKYETKPKFKTLY